MRAEVLTTLGLIRAPKVERQGYTVLGRHDNNERLELQFALDSRFVW